MFCLLWEVELTISKQTLLFHRVYAHLFLVCNMFSLSEGMVGVTLLTTGPTASMTEETAVHPRSPPERYKPHAAALPLPVSHVDRRRTGCHRLCHISVFSRREHFLLLNDSFGCFDEEDSEGLSKSRRGSEALDSPAECFCLQWRKSVLFGSYRSFSPA